MQYVYGKYGRDRAALAATLITYRPKSAVRDVGKALGLDLAQVDRLAGVFAWWDGRVDRCPSASARPASIRDSPLITRLVTLTGELMGFPRHLSQHVGGFVIARDLLERMVPVENAAMKDRTVIQWDKDDLDAMGLLKVDCLALGMLSAIRRALDMMSRYRGAPLRMQDIPAEDPAVYEMMPARRHDRRVPDRVARAAVDAAAAEARVLLRPRDRGRDRAPRPDPGRHGASVPARRQGLEPVTYPSAAVKSVLERTLGVPIFQEQVMQLAIVAAGFTPGEADQLRRSMAAWRRKGGLEKFEQRLIDGMAARGYAEVVRAPDLPADPGLRRVRLPRIALGDLRAARLRLVRGSSATSPRRSPRALLNSQPMGFYAPAQLVADARRHGVEVRPVDVDGERVGLHARKAAQLDPAQMGTRSAMARSTALRCASACAWSADSREAGAQAHRRSARAARRSRRRRPRAPRGARPPRPRGARRRPTRSRALAGHRHDAVWDVAGVERLPRAARGRARSTKPTPQLAGADRRPGHRRRLPARSASRCAAIRSRCCAASLRRDGSSTAADIARTPHGRLVRTAGIVIGRQRPDTASGVDLRHARGRDRRDQRDRLARPVRPPAPRAARLAADGGLRHGRARRARSCTCSPAGSST